MPPTMPPARRRPTRQELLEGAWVAYQHPEGEGYPVPEDVRSLIAAARALDPKRMDRRTLYLNLTEQREHRHRTGHTSAPRAPRRESFATAPKVATVAQRDARRRQMRRRVVDCLAVVVLAAVCLYAGHLFAVGIGGGR